MIIKDHFEEVSKGIENIELEMEAFSIGPNIALKIYVQFISLLNPARRCDHFISKFIII